MYLKEFCKRAIREVINFLRMTKLINVNDQNIFQRYLSSRVRFQEMGHLNSSYNMRRPNIIHSVYSNGV